MYVFIQFSTSIICRLQFETEEMLVFFLWSITTFLDFFNLLEPYVSMNVCLFECVFIAKSCIFKMIDLLFMLIEKG